MNKTASKFSFATALALTLASSASLVQAQEAKAEYDLTFNAAVTTDYRYRGMSQTRLKPAVQGGVDYVHNASGFYVGAWGSTIKWIKDMNGDADVELDLYGGKRGELGSGFTYDVGGLYYWYPSNDLPVNANTFELYGQVGYGPAYIKYSHSTTNLFGTADSKNSKYLDVGANLDLGSGFTLNLHAGRQLVANNGGSTYNDYKIGVSKDLGFATLSLAAIGTDTKAPVLSPVGNKDLGKTGAVLTLSKTF
jgi:uncharacterized protein (TIGR02001 family)